MDNIYNFNDLENRRKFIAKYKAYLIDNHMAREFDKKKYLYEIEKILKISKQ